jgi:O-antigen/teichoic acid export membrane protein
VGIILKKGLQNTIISYTGIVIGFVNIIILQPLFLDSTEVIGLLRTLIAISSFIALVAPLGISNITVKYFSHFRNEEKRHHGYLGFLLLYTTIGYAIVAIFLFFASDWIKEHYQEQSASFLNFYYLIFPMSFIISLVNVLNVYCNVIYKPVLPSFLNEIYIRIAYLAIILLYFMQVINVKWLMISYVLIYLFQLFALAIFIYKIDKPTLKYKKDIINKAKIVEMMTYGIPFTLATISAVGIKQIDSIMLGWYSTMSIVGIYTIAMFIPSIIEAPIPAVDKIAAPIISDAWFKKDHNDIRHIYFLSSKYLMLIGGILFLGVTCNIETLYKLLPSEYALGLSSVYIISGSSLFNMISGLNNQIIFSSENYKVGLVFLFLMFILTIAGNVLLIPIYGMTGAAIAIAIGSFSYNVLKFFFIWSKFKLQPFDSNTLKGLVIIGGTFLLGFNLPDLINPVFSIIYRSILITLVYGILVYSLKLAPEINDFIVKKTKNILRKKNA